MIVHRKKKARYEVTMPLSSLIDIVFMLLIYFLLTTNFMVDEGIQIKLPHARASKPQVEEAITIFVDKDGRAYLNEQEITMGDLFKTVKDMIGADKDKLVVVRADRTVILNKAVKVMDVAKSAGAGKLCLATEKDL
ncbi:Predicted biopolymer transport protein related to ExbD [uncultured Desulfobacterium sp.]|uniref:Predicted biopolymer transport protein related to ExbD n=1 Tax=uncultured Desulfobacterium sp. TaxID=201089 RepID=A0A445MTX0_9BACT|nr:Predicted biopolymer transport protein related to ExbD [uncultured Desulfobacterium sp.]